MNNHELTEYAESIAQEIFDQASDRDEMSDLAFRYADGSEHVIYYGKAHSICQNCDTSQGESDLKDTSDPMQKTYDGFATAIAFCELRCRIETALNALCDEE